MPKKGKEISFVYEKNRPITIMMTVEDPGYGTGLISRVEREEGDKLFRGEVCRGGAVFKATFYQKSSDLVISEWGYYNLNSVEILHQLSQNPLRKKKPYCGCAC